MQLSKRARALWIVLAALAALAFLSFPNGNPALLVAGNNVTPELVMLRAGSSILSYLPDGVARAVDLASLERRFDTEERGDHPGDWAKFRNMQLASDTARKIVRPDGLIRANAGRRQMLARQGATRGAGLARENWTWIGPGNQGGRIRTVLIDPSNSNVIWIGSVGGGIWKSTNAGASWAPVQDFMGNLAVTSLAMDPANSSIMYAATGEGFFNGDAIRGAGIFKSTDGGVTWNPLPATNPAANNAWYWVNRLAINSQGVMLAATWQGVFRSADGGASWLFVAAAEGESGVTQVAFAPDAPSRAMLAPGYSGGKIRTSADGGLTWSTTGLTGGGRAEVAFGTGGAAYAVVDDNNGTLYRSADFGKTWFLVSYPQHLSGQGWYSNAIWVDPTNSNHVIIGGLDLWRSVNGGTSFVKISDWQYGGQYGPAPHADHHAIVAEPGYNGTSRKRIYFGNDGGLYRADDIAAVSARGAKWTNLNNGLGITQFYSGAGHSGKNGQIVGGTQDNGHLGFQDGANWDLVAGGDGGDSAIDPTDGNYTYGEYVYLTLHRSTRRGQEASYIYKGIADADNDSKALFIAPFAIDAENPNRMWAGGTSLWRTTSLKSASPSWAAAVRGNELISAVADGPGDTVAFGTVSGKFYSANVPASGVAQAFLRTGSSRGATLPSGRALLAIKIDKARAGRIFVGFGGYETGNLWRSTDNGATWTDIHGNLPATPIYSIEISPQDGNRIYVGTEVGIFTSEDGGATWSAVNDGPANVSVMRLFWLDDVTLVAATHGRGMFKASTGVSSGIALGYTRAGPGSGEARFSPAGSLASCADSCSNNFPPGVKVKISAVAAPGSLFAGWTGDCKGKKTCTVKMSAARSVTATFNLLPVYTVTYLQIGSGSGTVSFQPSGGAASCSGNCANSYSKGTVVILTATPDPGSVFKGWKGGCKGKKPVCKLTVKAAKLVTANFTSAAAANP